MDLFSSASLAADATSSVVRMDQFEAFSIQSVVSGAPTGTLSVEVSNDNTNWSQADSVALSGGPINWAWVSREYPFKYLRLSYVRTSGTGSISAFVRGKGVMKRYTLEP